MDESSPVLFPNYQQTRKYLPPAVWHIGRAISVTATLAFVWLCTQQPQLALALFWGLAVPVLPLIFLVAPGLWRNLCPLATMNQLPRLFGFTLGFTIKPTVRRYANILGMSLLFAIVPIRKWFLNTDAEAVALLVLSALVGAFIGGVLFKGKSGWCSSICPMLSVERAYGQTPLILVSNSHCQPCVGCTVNCYDFNPHVAYLADLYGADGHLGADRRLFVGTLPGFLWAYFTLPDYPALSIAELYSGFAFYIMASAGSFFILETYLKISSHKITALYAMAGLNLFYWFVIPMLTDTLGNLLHYPLPQDITTLLQGAVLTTTLFWLGRTYRKELLYLRDSLKSIAKRSPETAPAQRQAAQSQSLQKHRVTLLPEETTLLVDSGQPLLDLLEANQVPIRAGCRMGNCGCDPITILAGAEHLAPPGENEQATLKRLGAGAKTRMACCVKISGDITLANGIDNIAADGAGTGAAAGARTSDYGQSFVMKRKQGDDSCFIQGRD